MFQPISTAAALLCVMGLAASVQAAIHEVDITIDLDASQMSVLPFNGEDHARWGPTTFPVTPFTMQAGDTADVTVRFANDERVRVGYVDGYFLSPYQLMLAAITGHTVNASFPAPGSDRPYAFLDYAGDLEAPTGSLAGGGTTDAFAGGNGDHRFTDTQFEFGGIAFSVPITGFYSATGAASFEVTGVQLMIGADTLAIVPEPASLTLLAAAAGTLLLARRRR